MPRCRVLPTRDTAAHPAGIRPQGLNSNFSPNRAAATRPRWALVLGGGQFWRGVPSRAAWGADPGLRGAEPGRLLPPALIPTATAVGGQGGCGGCGSLLRPPRARGTGCGRAGFSGESGVPLTPFSPSFIRRPARLKAAPGALQRLKAALAAPLSCCRSCEARSEAEP